MTPSDHLRAAARCWERAGFFDEAAERFTTAKAWSDAGRCFARAGRHQDAALAYFRAGELLLEAREHLMGGSPERARSIYRQLRPVSSFSPREQVDLLLGLGQVEEAAQATHSSGDREALERLARLAATRGRPDMAAPLWLQTVKLWENFSPWNRSLGWQFPAAAGDLKEYWPSMQFGEVELETTWQEELVAYSWGDRALAWSDDSTFFAAVHSVRGLVCGRIGSNCVHLERRRLPISAQCCRFVSASHSVLVGLSDGEVSLHRQDGSSQQVESLRMPSTVWSIAFAPESDRLAVAGWSNPGALLTISSWRKDHGSAQLERLREHEGDCHPLNSWSSNGRLCWSPGRSGQPNRLFLPGQQPVEAHGDEVTSLAFTTDARFLITASLDKTVVVSDGATGHSLAPPDHFASSVYGATVHPQAALIAVGEGDRLHLLRLHPGEVPRLSRVSEHSLDDDVRSLAFSPDGRHLLVMTWRHLHLFRVDLKP